MAQPRVDTNVVYGMVSGTRAVDGRSSSGHGRTDSASSSSHGSGWNAPLGYAAPPLKQSPQVAMYAPSLLEAGYTVFAITHRATPTFRYPAPVDDAQRAVRFIRHNAARFGIDAARIGGSGGSSGAHLVSMLATMDGSGDSSDPDPVNRESAKLQCVVARAAPVDLLRIDTSAGATAVALLLGARVDASTPKGTTEYKVAAAASPDHLRIAGRSADPAHSLAMPIGPCRFINRR